MPWVINDGESWVGIVGADGDGLVDLVELEESDGSNSVRSQMGLTV